MAASILTLFGNNPKQSGSSALLLTLTQPGASTSTTGWTVGKIAATNYSRQTSTIENATTTFAATAQPSGAPANAAEDSWRISAATTGDFSAGTWYSSLSVLAVTAGATGTGNARFRLWRSANADGTSATEITKGAMVGGNVANLLTTVAQSSSASTQVGAFSLANEYLFLQTAWQITVASGSNTADTLIRLGSLAQTSGTGLITSAFSGTGGAAVVGAGFYNEYYKNVVQELS